MALTLTAGDGMAEVVPEQGGGLAALRVGGRPALCPGAGRPEGSPFALAMNLLLPFSNRISRPFAFEGQEHRLEPNLPGEPFPIHGDGFQRPWTVASHDGSSATLRLGDGAFGPFRYEAEVVYRLDPGGFDVALSLVSRADGPLPWGLGFHPWFPRTAATRLRFVSTGYWPEDDRHLPATATPQPLPEGWTWSEPAPLPATWINAGFSGWDGTAELHQGDEAVSLRIEAPDLSTLLVYSPSAEAPFLCLEPISHPVDAHNLPGRPGLVTLAPGESLSATLRLEWHPEPHRAFPSGLI